MENDFIKELKQKTETDATRRAREQATALALERAERAEAKRQAVKTAKTFDLPQIKTQMLDNAANRSLTYTVTQWRDEDSDADALRARTLVELLKEMGLKASTGCHVDEPCGSDPLFYNTVYSRWVKVEW